MIDFLIKSSITLFVLLPAYHLFLEKEKIHIFNRFYLLFSLVFSMVIPFITIEIIQEVAQPIVPAGNIQILQGSAIALEETNYFEIGLWSLYVAVTIILAIRFISNIIQISSKMKSNTPIVYRNAKLILVPEKTLPHTFLNTIFINETEYNNRKIEAELYTHELTHVSQKHTLDILFIEILKTVFWFNPIFIFYKKAIQLNHEFLADEKVVTSYNNVPFYQSLLLSKANVNQPFYLASNLNYLITKKRLIMMTKTTSKTKSLLKKMALIPLLTSLILLLCIETVAQGNSQKGESTLSKDKKKDIYYAGVRLIVKDSHKKILINKKYEDLTLNEKRLYIAEVPASAKKNPPTAKEFNNWKNDVNFRGILDKRGIVNTDLSQYTYKDIATYAKYDNIIHNGKKIEPSMNHYILQTNSYFEKHSKKTNQKSYFKVIEKTIKDGSIKNPVILKDVSKQKDISKVIPANKHKNNITAIQQPEFPGGMNEFYKFMGANYKIPTELKGNGRVYIKFMVEKDGSLSEFEILRDMGFGTGEEAIRVLKLSPKWIPGKDKDKPVRVQYSLPITLQQTK
ncbi:M56 family metallopeptidase [Flavobacterium xinjiangense]|uniref:TonB protein C-terminal n=1 Tax=Flavobacterium xinjiangense TaxID=178356 RepID=A0A1M7FLH5_9FLAO|nr:M56 family metallopeptidase [Flavobacterium xinjiangense]SHM04873.1 TonB protein C-terminal [Flavobacterium xinjiangense]